MDFMFFLAGCHQLERLGSEAEEPFLSAFLFPGYLQFLLPKADPQFSDQLLILCCAKVEWWCWSGNSEVVSVSTMIRITGL